MITELLMFLLLVLSATLMDLLIKRWVREQVDRYRRWCEFYE